MRVSLRHTFFSVEAGADAEASSAAQGGERRARSEEPVCRSPLQRDEDDVRRQFSALSRLLDAEAESPASSEHQACDAGPIQNLPPTLQVSSSMLQTKFRTRKASAPSQVLRENTASGLSTLGAPSHEGHAVELDWDHEVMTARPLGKVGQVSSSGSVCTTVPEGCEGQDEMPHVGSSNSVSTMAACGSSNSVCTMASVASSHQRQGSSSSPGHIQQKTSSARLSREGASSVLRIATPPPLPERGSAPDCSLASPASSSTAAAEKTAQRQQPKDCKHCNVPRHLNLAEEYAKSGHDGKATTIMIRNLPHRCGQRELIAELEALRFGGTFDFLYIPLDPGTMYNVGYSFVNFVDHTWAERCMQVFDGHCFRRYRNSGKPTAVSIAHIQGLEGNLRHYEKSVVNTARLRQRRPVVMANISHSLAESAGCSEESARDRASTL